MIIKKLIEKSLQIFESKTEAVIALQEDNKFFLIKHHDDLDSKCYFSKPFFCLILQGVREVIMGGRMFEVRKGQSFIGTHNSPMMSSITKASSEKPYIALVLNIDFNIIRSLYEKLEEFSFTMIEETSGEVKDTNEELLDSLFRLMLVSQNKIDSLVLCPQIYREVHYRLLQAPYGQKIRTLLRVDSHARHISKAIVIIRTKYNETLIIANLAKSVGMSSSSFHNHFKSITKLTPLQYQKNLRLLKAKMLIKTKGISVTAAAFEVGYKSKNQFSREYTRKFNVSPSSDRSL
ncbi:AraC family transcriptional regulator [Moritella sp. Urea-trap-13]|uniref:AraC family transcriptional regulator n=1 Tax=Moritella sp. Urea-trap-13 TaxID=2058327 RepID=UPI000C31BD01|nr:AraC family transcriptional regulator [Moritella sp. Urea-trap-13]PKH05497.1 AraC family transcriptional regulator [Moritella sp. Urea-trap-13]